MIEDLSVLSNEEIFKLCKSSGINAGPITATTRSVYEKKLKNYLNEINNESVTTVPNSTKIESEPIDVLKPRLHDDLKHHKNFFVEPNVQQKIAEPETIFVKPATPKSKERQDILQVDKSRRSILKNSEQKTFENIQFNDQFYTRDEAVRMEILNKESLRNENSAVIKKVSEKEMPEFKLLKPQNNYMGEEPSQIAFQTSSTTNIRKRTATFDKPTVLISNIEKSDVPLETKKSKSGIFNPKAMILVALVTTLVYFVMIHLQSNPENPVE